MTELIDLQHLSINDAFSLASQLHKDKNYKRAQAIYHFILNLDPNHYKSIGNLGLLYIQINQLEQAEGYLKLAISINPNYYEGYTNLGSLYFHQERYSLAIRV